MFSGKTVFSQAMSTMPLRRFHTCVRRYEGDHKVQRFRCLEQFYVMAFAQLTFRESLRDIEACLRAMQSKLYHMGIQSRVSRSTLARANEVRSWRIYADFAHILIAIARDLYAEEDFGAELQKASLYALDSTTIDLCLSLFPWAKFRKIKAGVKLHTLLDLRGSIPTFIHVSNAIMHDVNVLDLLIPEPGAYYILDRGYLDFERLFRLDQAQAFFVTRARRRFAHRRRYSRPVDKSTGVQCDQHVLLTSHGPAKKYPIPLRRIRYLDPESGKRLVFLTNQFALPADSIAMLYKARWQIELFFKWIKQHLRIKAFYGTSPNAVKTQIWIAVSTYLLIAILKKDLGLHHSLYTILQVLSVSLFEKTPIPQLFTDGIYENQTGLGGKQLNLFN